MKAILTLLLFLILYSTGTVKATEIEEDKGEKIYEFTSNDRRELDFSNLSLDKAMVNYYPVLMVDLFYIFDVDYYKNKSYTKILYSNPFSKNYIGIKIKITIKSAK